MPAPVDGCAWHRDSRVVMQFSERLQGLMAEHQPPLTQAMLATRTGLDASLVSRLARGERLPTPEALGYIAKVLNIGVDELVRGTDAASKLAKTVDPIRDKEYGAVVAKLVEFEADAREAKARVQHLLESSAEDRRQRRIAMDGKRVADDAAELALSELRSVKLALAERERELAVTQQRLAKVVAMFDSLRSKVNALEAELGATNKSAKVAALFGAIGAATGVATLSLLFGTDDELDDDDEDADADDDDE